MTAQQTADLLEAVDAAKDAAIVAGALEVDPAALAEIEAFKAAAEAVQRRYGAAV